MMNVIHVHVGKCAGSSINMALNQEKIIFKELHCGDANTNLEELIESDSGNNLYVVSARDPIKRFISAFNWDKYEKIINRKANNPYWRKIYETFTDANDLAESLKSSDTEKRKLAEFALNGSKLHMDLGLDWYIPKALMLKIPKDRLYLVRTENLLNDFNRFVSSYKQGFKKIDSMPRDKDSNDFIDKINIENPKYLSSKAKDILREKLNVEFEVLEYISSVSC